MIQYICFFTKSSTVLLLSVELTPGLNPVGERPLQGMWSSHVQKTGYLINGRGEDVAEATSRLTSHKEKN